MYILSIDVENTPNMAYIWDLFHNDYVSNEMLVQAKRIFCFAGQWLGEDIPTGYTSEPVFYSDFHDGHGAMVESMHYLLNVADVAVYYNGDRFDRPLCNREMWHEHFTPPSPYKRVDLYKVIRAEFGFPSGKLDYVSQEMGIGQKVQHEGFDLWRKCMAQDPDAWAKMMEYNIGDVVLTGKLFYEMLPWIPGLPSFGAMNGLDVCPGCGNPSLTKEGFAYTRTGKYQRFSCHQCGTWSRDTHRMDGTRRTQVAV